MKKILIALAAVAALASCSKVEAEYEQTGEITLTPVTKNITKTMKVCDKVFMKTIGIWILILGGVLLLISGLYFSVNL